MKSGTYYQRNRAKVLRKTRQTRLTTKGGKVMTGLNKRPYTRYCELCGKKDRVGGEDIRLHYHHWNPKVPNLGIWLCFACHIFAELMDNPKWPDMARAYETLKNATTEEYAKANS